MKVKSSIVSLCMAIFISLVFVSTSYAKSPKSFDEMSQAEKDKKYQLYMNQLQDRIRSLQSGKTLSVSPKDMKAQQATNEFLRKYAQDAQKKSYSNSRSAKPVRRDGLRIERERMRKQQRARSASYRMKKDVIADRWVNSKGINLNFARTGFVNFSGYKSMSWTRKNSAISFYVRGSKGKQKGARKPITGLYNKNKDSITLSGTKYADATFIRANTPKGRIIMKAAMAEHRAQRIRNIQAKEKKYQAELKAKRDSGRFNVDETWTSKTGPNTKGLKVAREFEKTLKCNNCDLRSLKNHIFNCNWCEAEGSNFARKDMSWSRYDFKWAKLKGAKFSGTSIRESSFYKADLRGADFSGARIGATNFAYANLENASFRNAFIGESLFNGANLKNADFTGAKIVRADFSFADVNEEMLKSENLEDVKLKATLLDKQIIGVWHMNGSSNKTYYYEFFEDGSYILTPNIIKRLTETQTLSRVFKEQHFYSIRKGAFEKMTPNKAFFDTSRYTRIIPTTNGNKLVFTDETSKGTTTYTRTTGKALAKYLQIRNMNFALRSAYLWNTDVIEKLSSSGVNYAILASIYGVNIFDNMFQHYKVYHRVQDDRHTRYIFKFLFKNNPEFKAGSNFEKLLVIAMKYGYIETLAYILKESQNKSDMQYALLKFKESVKGDIGKSKAVKMIEKRISEL